MSRCSATSKRSREQCKRNTAPGADVCSKHGGNAPQVRAAAARRAAEGKAFEALQRHGAVPVDNPLEAFRQLAGEVVTLKDWLGGAVERLEEIRYRGGSGEQIRGELAAYSNAIDQCRRVLSDYGRLNVDERLATISEKQAQIIAAGIALFWRRISGDATGLNDLRDTFSQYMELLLRSVVVRESGEWETTPGPGPGAGLQAKLDVIRDRLMAPSRQEALERELAMSRDEVAALVVQRDELLAALRRKGSPALAIEAPKPQESTFLGIEVSEVVPAAEGDVDGDATSRRSRSGGGKMRYPTSPQGSDEWSRYRTRDGSVFG